MSSFLEKLKKGMQNQPSESDPEIISEEIGNENGQNNDVAVFASYSKKGIPSLDEGTRNRKTKLREKPKKMITQANQLEEIENQEPQITPDSDETDEADKKISKKTMAKKTLQPIENKKEPEWLNGEGQLTVDVYQTENDLVVQSAIAGIKVEDLDVLIEDDLITIKGNRPNPLQETGDYFIEECYWGQFSRKIILPVEVDSSRADAAMKDGILTIRIPKIQREKKKKVIVKE